MVRGVVDHERLRGWDIVSGGGKKSPNRDVFLLRIVVFAPRKHHALAFVSESKMLRIPFAHLITISRFEEDTTDSKDAPALLRFDRRLRLFRLRRLHFLSSFCAHRDEQQRAERNCDPGYSLHARIIHKFSMRMEKTVRSRVAAIQLSRSRMNRSLTVPKAREFGMTCAE